MGDAILATVLALVVANVVGAIALSAANVSDTDDLVMWAVLLLGVPLWLMLIGVPYWVARRKGSGSLREDFGLSIRWRDLPIGLGAGLATQVALSLTIPPLYRLIGIDADKIGDTADKLGDRAQSFGGALCLFLMVVVLAPLAEEIAYRGLWLRAAQRRLGIIGGIVLSAAVFAVMHLQPYDTLSLFGIGLVLGWLASRFRRLGPSICAHAWFNLAAFIVLVSK